MPVQRSGKKWKMAVTAMVIFFVSALFATMMLASHSIKVLDHDYYHQGMNYGQQSKAADKASGWKINSSLRVGVLQVKVSDSNGIPVTGAEAGFAHRNRAEKTQIIMLAESEPGLYQTTLALQNNNEVRGTIFIKRGDAAISEKLALFR